MSQILTYVGLHFKLALKKDKKSDSKSEITTLIIGLLTCAVLLFLFRYLFGIINKQMLSEITPQKFSILIISIIELALILFGIVFEIKFFLKPKDINLTACLPLSSTQLFIAQLLIVYVYLLAISFLLIMPIMIIYSISAQIISVVFVLRLIPACLLAPLIPFAFATLFVVPVAYIMTLIEDKNWLKLILFLILLAVSFFIYSKFLNFLADYYIYQRVDANAKNLIANFINAIDKEWIFSTYVNNIIFGTQVWKYIGLVLAVFIAVLAIGIVVAIPIHKKMRINVIEGNRKSVYKATKLTQDNAFVSIFKNEFKSVVRTRTYAYFYLGVAIITPVMVLLTNNLIHKVGTAQIGSSIVFGISLIIMLVFMCIINSFSASAISREGREFYITKIIPVGYKTQLLAKGLLNQIISLGVLILSTIILYCMHFVSALQGLVVFAVSLITSIGLIINGFNINVVNPSINKREHGEESQVNSSLTMVIGFSISALDGILAIVLQFFVCEAVIYLILIAISLVYAIVNIVVFHFTIDKKYSQIE